MGIYAHHISLNAIWCELGISADVVPLQLGYALIVVSCRRLPVTLRRSNPGTPVPPHRASGVGHSTSYR